MATPTRAPSRISPNQTGTPPITPLSSNDVSSSTGKRRREALEATEDTDEDNTESTPTHNKKKKKSTPAPKRRECTVCLSRIVKNQFPKLPHANEGEEHSSDVCFKCWDEHLKSEVGNKGFEAVSCPQCSKTLAETEVRKLAKRSTYREYLDKAAKGCMQQDEEFHACPNSDCSWGAFFAKDDGNIFVCQLCNVRHCLSCDVPFHEDQTCEQYLEAKRLEIQAENEAPKRRAEEEAASLEAVRGNSRPCPKCGVNIDKYDGCDHVTCGRTTCRHEFCWQCAAPYLGDRGIMTIGNTAHQETCMYASGRLPGYVDGNVSEEEDPLVY